MKTDLSTQMSTENQDIMKEVGLNNIYLVIINTIVNIYTMSCETGSDSKHKAYI